jgi:mercuric ion binding protein
MRLKHAVFLALGLLMAPLPALAAEASITLTVHHAGCVLCGPIVKSTLAHVNGVKAVRVSQPNGMANVTALVTYDSAETTPAALIKATTDRGYPADLAKKPGSRS